MPGRLSAMRIYRVLVGGRFGELDDAVRSRLLAEADDHDVLGAAFTEGGTLTYDRSLAFFTCRYQLRVDDGTDGAAVAEAVARATADLAAYGVSHGELEARAIDMASAWR
jgi:hypothetical protein